MSKTVTLFPFKQPVPPAKRTPLPKRLATLAIKCPYTSQTYYHLVKP